MITANMPEPYRSIIPLQEDLHGWFAQGNQIYLASFIKHYNPRVVVELGSWLGLSAIFMASHMQDGAILYAIDNWTAATDSAIQNNQSIHSKLPTLYQQFLSNVIHHSLTEKIVPIRMDTLEAARSFNIKANLIYVDASHDEESVYQDIMHWWRHLDPINGIMCGDDYAAESVRKGLTRAAQELNLQFRGEGNFWYLVTPIFKRSFICNFGFNF